MSKLPDQWVLTNLESLISSDGLLSDGDWIESRDQDPKGQVRLIQLADIGNGTFRNRSSRFVSSETAKRLRCTFLNEGDLLIARMPDPLGRACIFPGVGQKAITAVDVFICRPGSAGILTRWLMYFVNSPSIRKSIAAQSSGSTRQRVSSGRLKKLELPVPPLGEQERIVAKLDSAMARTAHLRGELSRIGKLVSWLKQVSLSAMLKQTAADFEHVSVADVAKATFDGPFGSNLKSKDYTDDGKRVVRLENIGHLSYRSENETFVSNEKFDSLIRHKLRSGDVLFSSFVDEDVRVCILPKTLDSIAINKADVFCIRPDKRKCLPRFLMYVLGQVHTYHALKELVHGATRPRINLKQLKAYSFPLPPLAVQQQLVRRMDDTFSRINQIDAETKQALTLIDRLEESILAKAFCGELTPQDPADEAAAVLLERIVATRAKVKNNREKERERLNEDDRSNSEVQTAVKGQGRMEKARNDVTKDYLSSLLKGPRKLPPGELWRISGMTIEEFYKQLRQELSANKIRQTADKELEAA